jgi:hypothetical protein
MNPYTDQISGLTPQRHIGRPEKRGEELVAQAVVDIEWTFYLANCKLRMIISNAGL